MVGQLDTDLLAQNRSHNMSTMGGHMVRKEDTLKNQVKCYIRIMKRSYVRLRRSSHKEFYLPTARRSQH